MDVDVLMAAFGLGFASGLTLMWSVYRAQQRRWDDLAKKNERRLRP